MYEMPTFRKEVAKTLGTTVGAFQEFSPLAIPRADNLVWICL